MLNDEIKNIYKKTQKNQVNSVNLLTRNLDYETQKANKKIIKVYFQ
jgi:hypothetical protein